VTVNQIITKAGASKGGFYHHFQTKDELLYIIHDTFITYVLAEAVKAEKAYQSPAKKLQAIIREFVKVFDLYKAQISVFYQETIYLKPQYDVLIRKKRDHFKRIIIQTIHEGKQCGEFRKSISAEITGMAILGMVNWTYKWYKRDGAKTIEEIGDIFIDLTLHSLLHPNLLNETLYNEVRIDHSSTL
jgi:AcrR family transcriptional regulator